MRIIWVFLRNLPSECAQGVRLAISGLLEDGITYVEVKFSFADAEHLMKLCFLGWSNGDYNWPYKSKF